MTSQLKVDRISPANGSEIIIDGFGGGVVIYICHLKIVTLLWLRASGQELFMT